MNEVRLRFSALSQEDFAVFMALAERIGDGDFPRYRQVAESLSARAEAVYQDYLRGHKLPDGRAVPLWLRGEGGGELAGMVTRREDAPLVWNIALDDERAAKVEDGCPAWDMKLGLSRYRKARISKDGTFYLIVPFRHGIPTSKNLGRPMPKAIYAQAKQLVHSRQLGAPATRVSATGFTVPKFAYRWNGKLELSLAQFDLATVKRYGGMYRMNRVSGNSVHTEYITFRVMSQKSPAGSWIRPAVPALNALKQAISQTWVNGRASLEEALSADLADIIRP